MSIYLYLNEKWHADNWVNGGVVPISYASKYLSEERSGIFTPDENLIYDTPFPIEQLSPYISFGPGTQLKNMTVKNNIVNGKPMPEIRNGNKYNEDGLVICCSNTLSCELAGKLGNKKAVLEITHPQKLLEAIDEQLGIKGIVETCTYTENHQRNHFLKSTEDKWQDECRFFWKYDRRDGSKDINVNIPKGIAKLVSCSN
tara:strand:- start:733 stop:1332 length:600 start_codon:yes stop_codon:yes gene_type:complete